MAANGLVIVHQGRPFKAKIDLTMVRENPDIKDQSVELLSDHNCILFEITRSSGNARRKEERLERQETRQG